MQNITPVDEPRRQCKLLREVWKSMIARCYRVTHHAFHRYGGRGITVCDEWIKNRDAFLKWAFSSGYEIGLQLDRIDNDGDYLPRNCRWTTRRVQMQNRSSNHKVEAFGEAKCLAEWPRDPRCIIGESCLRHRLRDGWSPEHAMATPPHRGWFGERSEEYKRGRRKH